MSKYTRRRRAELEAEADRIAAFIGEDEEPEELPGHLDEPAQLDPNAPEHSELFAPPFNDSFPDHEDRTRNVGISRCGELPLQPFWFLD